MVDTTASVRRDGRGGDDAALAAVRNFLALVPYAVPCDRALAPDPRHAAARPPAGGCSVGEQALRTVIALAGYAGPRARTAPSSSSCRTGPPPGVPGRVRGGARRGAA